MAAETKVIIDMEQKGIEITCKHCGKSQTYTMRSKKIPNRPKTQCTSCEKWIYIDKSLLVKNDQRPKDKKQVDQKEEMLKVIDQGETAKGDQETKKKASIRLTKTDDQKPKDNDQMTKDEKLYIYLRAISGDLVIALNYAINAIKNKPEVKEKRLGATRYDYFKNWSQYRVFFKELDEELKKEIKIIK